MAKPVLQELAITQLCRGRYQPRRDFDEAQLQELADSIRSAGLLQPIIVRPLAADKFEIVAGERRWRAAQLAKLATINCLVNNYTDEQAAEAATIENINRVDLNPIEEAQAYQRLIDEFGYLHEEVAAAIGKSRVKITNSLRLLKLDHAIKTLIEQGQLSEGHGKTLVGLAANIQYRFAQKSIKQGWSVRKLEREVKQYHKEQELSPSLEKDIDVQVLERELSRHIGCQTRVDFSAGKGQLKIDFHNLDILDGVLFKLGYKEKL